MHRVPPSDRTRQRVTELLESGLESEDSPLGALMRLSAELVVQEAWRGRQLNGWEEVTMSAVRKTSL